MKKWTSLLLACSVALPALAQAATFTVNDAADNGPGTLRQAIIDANGSANVGGPDLIEFNIPGGGVHTIVLLSVLPAIVDPTIVDGYTQPGSSPNTLGPGEGSNAVILIELDGSSLANADGLVISGTGDTTIRGLAIHSVGSAGIFGSGISLDSGNNRVEGCFLGTDASGTQALPNQTRGVFVTSDNNAIGGTAPAARNLISGNNERGIFIIGGNDNVVVGNLIGTDITGTQALGNVDDGINIQTSSGNIVGGITPEERNVISGNLSTGINLFSNTGNPATATSIQGNYIGTDVTGSQALANGNFGISFGGNIIVDNLVGGTGPGEGNLIAFNVNGGVIVSQGTGMGILGNSIHSNDGLGIELGAGANNDQPAPVLSAAALNGGLSVQGTLTAAPDTEFLVEFFANRQCDESGSGEGETFLGRVTVVTDGAGLANIDFGQASTFQFSATAYSAEEGEGSAIITVTRTLPAVPEGGVITATATDPTNNTSQFSNCQAVGGSSEASVDFATSDGSAIAGVDYVATSGTLTFAAGETSQNFEVELLVDNLAEGDETVDLTLSNPSTGSELGDPATAVLTIVDTGALPEVRGGGCSLGGGSAFSFAPMLGMTLALAVRRLAKRRKA